MSICIGQISYLPDSDVRNKRLEAARTQIEWLHELLPNAKIITVAQAYDESELPSHECIVYENGIGPGTARNVLLQKFYASDYDWLLLCDDDTTAYDYYNYQEFIRDIADNPRKFHGIDAVSAVEPEYHPYKKLNFQDKNNLTHYKFEPRELNSGSATSIIRNMRKYHGVEIFYPDTDARKGEGREDIEFLMEWLKLGYTWYTMQTWIRKSLCFDKSSLFGTDTKARDVLLMHDLDVLCDKYKDDGLQRVNGKITWKNFNQKYNKSKKVLYIQRDTQIDYEDNVKPVEKKKPYSSINLLGGK